MFSADLLTRFLREAVPLPPDMQLKVTGYGTGLTVGILDGDGLGCRFLRLAVGSPERFDASQGAALRGLVQETERAVFALCEYPERFSNEP